MADSASADGSMEFWLRMESKPHEQRTPLTPRTCLQLLEAGEVILPLHVTLKCTYVLSVVLNRPNDLPEVFFIGTKKLSFLRKIDQIKLHCRSITACTKTRNNETKRAKRNHRNE